jgi:quercetin dioxygenase-like cupin family protein
MSTLSLHTLQNELRAEAAAAGTTVARRKVTDANSFTQMAIWLASGGELPEHGNPGDARLFIASGTVRFIETESGVTHTLTGGDLFEVPLAMHRVVAEQESLLLLTFAIGA